MTNINVAAMLEGEQEGLLCQYYQGLYGPWLPVAGKVQIESFSPREMWLIGIDGNHALRWLVNHLHVFYLMGHQVTGIVLTLDPKDFQMKMGFRV